MVKTLTNKDGIKVTVGETYHLLHGDTIVVESFAKDEDTNETVVLGPVTTTQLGKTSTYAGWAWLDDCRKW